MFDWEQGSNPAQRVEILLRREVKIEFDAEVLMQEQGEVSCEKKSRKGSQKLCSAGGHDCSVIQSGITLLDISVS